MSITKLRVACSTRERLKNQGRKGQTYGELINNLIGTLGNDTKSSQSSQDFGFESLRTSPTTGQSLQRFAEAWLVIRKKAHL